MTCANPTVLLHTLAEGTVISKITEAVEAATFHRLADAVILTLIGLAVAAVLAMHTNVECSAAIATCDNCD